MTINDVFSMHQPGIKLTSKALRKKLSGYGLRGSELRAELTRIMAGPQLQDGGHTQHKNATEDILVYPFGWKMGMMDRRTKRLFACIRPLPTSLFSRADSGMKKSRRSVVSLSSKYLSTSSATS